MFRCLPPTAPRKLIFWTEALKAVYLHSISAVTLREGSKIMTDCIPISQRCVWKCGMAGLMHGATMSIIPPLPGTMQRL